VKAAPRRAQTGVALLIAMLVLTLVASAAAAMVMTQQRAVDAEAGDRARAQGALLLAGGLDFVRLQLAGQNRSSFPPAGWISSLPESSVAALLAADRDNNADSGEIEAYLSGEIVDAQSRYNLRLLFDGGTHKPVDAEVQALTRLCQALGLPPTLPALLVTQLEQVWFNPQPESPLPPSRVEHLPWLGLDPALLAPLEPYVTLLPTRTPVNLNTAPPPVLMAVIANLGAGDAQRVADTLARTPAANIDAVRALLPVGVTLGDANTGVNTNFFEVVGRLRTGERMLQERWLIQRGAQNSGETTVLRRERIPAVGAA
jgi:general secretion pathway protein K